MNMKLSFGLVTLISTIFITSNPEVLGQGVGVAIGRNGVQLSGFGEVDLEKTLEHWSKEQRTIIQSKMELRVAQVVEVCGLNDADAKKLKIATKGIVSRRLAAGQSQIEQFSKQSGLIKPSDDEPEEQKNEIADEDKLNFYGASPLGVGIVEFKTYFEKPLSTHSLWIKTLKKTLTEEQMAKYSTHRKATNLKLLRSATELWLVRLDSEIFLSPKQQSSIRQLVEKQLDKLVSASEPENFLQANQMIEKNFGKKPEVIASMLSKNQLERLKVTLQPQKGSRVTWAPRKR